MLKMKECLRTKAFICQLLGNGQMVGVETILQWVYWTEGKEVDTGYRQAFQVNSWRALRGRCVCF